MSRRIFAKLEAGFLQDHRMMMLSSECKVAYLGFWTRAVYEGKETLTPQECDPNVIARWADVRPSAVRTLLELCKNMDRPLLELDSNGAVTVCGASIMHPRLVQQRGDREEKRREEEEKRREEKKKPRTEGEKSATPKQEISPLKPETIQEALEVAPRLSEVADPDTFLPRLWRIAANRGFDAMSVLYRIEDWARRNPAKMKKYRDLRRFYVTWFSREDGEKRKVADDANPISDPNLIYKGGKLVGVRSGPTANKLPVTLPELPHAD